MRQDPSVTVILWRDDGGAPTEVPLADVIDRTVSGPLVWVDVCAPDSALMDSLAQRFALHPLVVENTLRGFQSPRARDFETHYFLVWHVLKGHGHRELRSELDIAVGPDFVVTAAPRPVGSFVDLRRGLCAGPVLRELGADALLYALLDSVVDDYFPVLDDMAAQADRIEETMLDDPDREDLKKLLDVKHTLLALRKTLGPERDSIGFLERREAARLSTESFRYLQDVRDNLIRLVDTVDTVGEIVNGSMDIYLSVVSNRLNEIMKKLTVVATVFMPATLISSFFGMNFLHIPGLRSVAAFWGVVVFILSIAAAMLIYFRVKDWW